MNIDFKNQQASPEWLTSTLHQHGFLDKGEVISTRWDTPELASGSFISNFQLLKLTYSDNSSGIKPASLILKSIRSEYLASEQHRELNYYQSTLSIQSELPQITCYGTAVNPETSEYCLLLEDLTSSHYQTAYPVPPTRADCEAAIDALARIHAFWWNHHRFGLEGFNRPTEDLLRTYFDNCVKAYPGFVDFLKDRISTRRKQIFNRVFESAPKMIWEFVSRHEKQTISHGDSHFWNFMFPNNPTENQCRIIDWQGWGIGLAAKDLAYTMAYYWYPSHRNRLERPLLEYYLKRLASYGVSYTWENLFLEYRACAVMNLLTPVLWFSYQYAPNLWWNHFEKAFAAFDDLHCLELL